MKKFQADKANIREKICNFHSLSMLLPYKFPHFIELNPWRRLKLSVNIFLDENIHKEERKKDKEKEEKKK